VQKLELTATHWFYVTFLQALLKTGIEPSLPGYCVLSSQYIRVLINTCTSMYLVLLLNQREKRKVLKIYIAVWLIPLKERFEEKRCSGLS
jgi:cbb3-type cytochrome oxidase subunit 1